MTFSIIVPVYNAEQYLSDCISSVRMQSHPEWEVVLVDDGSAEPCARLCDETARMDNRIRVLHQKNAGQLLARMNGVKAAGGDYCLFLDADDTLAPDCLLTLRQTIEKHGRPDLVLFSFYYENPDGTRKKAVPLFENERVFTGEDRREVYRLFFTGTGLNNVWTKAVKKDVFAGRYPDYVPFASLRCGEDRLFAMGLMDNAERIVSIPGALYHYRLFPDSVTRQFTMSALDRFNVSALYPCEVGYLKQWRMDSEEMRQRLNASYCAGLLYMFDRFYLRLRSADDRERLMEYDWQAFLPEPCLLSWKTNPYLNGTQKKLFQMILAGEKQSVARFYRKKIIYQAARAWKRKLIP